MPTVAPPECLAFDRIPTPAGEALVMWDKNQDSAGVRLAGYEPRMRRLLERHYGPTEPKSAPAPKPLMEALTGYFEGDLKSPDAIVCATGGTPFQRAVWEALRDIPAGSTLSYGGLAQRIGKPGGGSGGGPGQRRQPDLPGRALPSGDRRRRLAHRLPRRLRAQALAAAP